jgi:hypothetical protein
MIAMIFEVWPKSEQATIPIRCQPLRLIGSIQQERLGHRRPFFVFSRLMPLALSHAADL